MPSRPSPSPVSRGRSRSVPGVPSPQQPSPRPPAPTGLPSPRCCRCHQQQQQRPEARCHHGVRVGPAAEKPGARPPFCGGSAAPWQREGAGRRRGPRHLRAGTAAPPPGRGRARSLGVPPDSSTEMSSLPKPPLLLHSGIVTSPCGSPLKRCGSHSSNCMRKGAGFITNGLYKV